MQRFRIFFFAAILSFTASAQSIEIDHLKPSLEVSHAPGDIGIVVGYYDPGSQQIGYQVSVSDRSNNETIRLFGGNQGNAPHLSLYSRYSGDRTIAFFADGYGNQGELGRVITDQLEIKAGSDLAEYFDILEDGDVQPGMLAAIDPVEMGKLTLTTQSYDPRVAGIVSGANGLATGMFMGQQNSIADGAHPIALTGRAFVYATKENGDINPGDLLTSSSTPGYAMRVKKRKKAAGAIIGKAMSGMDENGFVLVLINLQ